MDNRNFNDQRRGPQALQPGSHLILFYIAAFLTIFVVTYYGFSKNKLYLVAAMGVLPFMCLLVNRRDIWLVLIICLAQSGLQIPGLPSQLRLVHILEAGLIVVVIAGFVISKKPSGREGAYWGFMHVFLVTLLVTMYFRGAGFQMLGDSMSGGMRYITLLLTFCLPFVAHYVPLTSRQWLTAITIMICLSLLPFFADLLFLLSKGKIYWQYHLLGFKGGAAFSFRSIMAGEMVRYQAAGTVGNALGILPLLFVRFEKKNLVYILPFTLVGFILCGLSGHRLSVITLVGFYWLFGLYNAVGRRFLYVIGSCVCTAFVLLLLVFFAHELPQTFQRSLTFLPFLDLDLAAASNAAGTSQWRLEVWRRAIPEIPQYLLLGKGYTYNQSLIDSIALMPQEEANFLWAGIQAAYHNGILSLLIGMGIPGLISGLGILLFSSARHLKITSGVWASVVLNRIHNVLTIQLVLSAFIYCTIYGDVYVSFPGVFFKLMLLEGLHLSDKRLLGEAAAGGSDLRTDPDWRLRQST